MVWSKRLGKSCWILARDVWAEEDNIWGSETLEIRVIVVTKVNILYFSRMYSLHSYSLVIRSFLISTPLLLRGFALSFFSRVIQVRRQVHFLISIAARFANG
jgi:hypothetical protein